MFLIKSAVSGFLGSFSFSEGAAGKEVRKSLGF